MSAIIDNYPTDVTVSEVHSYPGEATRFPVEVGADTTDHIRELPDEIALECIVSDTPIGEIATHPTRQSVGPEAPLPSADAFQRLREMKRTRRPVTVTTSRGTFDQMACIDFETTNDKDKSGGLFFSIRFQRIEMVTNRRTRIRVATPMAGAGGRAKAKKKAVDEFVRVGAKPVTTWRRGVTPGGPLRPGFKWAHVVTTTTTVAREVSQQATQDISGRLRNRNVIYRFTGTSSVDFDPPPVPDAQLTAAQVDAFLLDRARDAEFARTERLYELRQGYKRPPSTDLTPQRQVQTTGPANRNLPPEIADLEGRFNRPAPGPTFPAQGPSTTFPTGTPVIGGR
jgi:hypothetical protein